jgi:hypothetical protein
MRIRSRSIALFWRRFLLSAGSVGLLGALTGTPALAVGPTSILYLINYGEFGASTGLDLIQGLSESSFATANSVDTCIAASGDIRTFGYSSPEPGSRFNLGGAPLVGGPYTNNYGGQLHDGTSDGLYNYTVDYVTGKVLQFDRNWANDVTLFTIANGTAGWITMNPNDGSFWISQFGGPDLVEHRTHAGALISSFNSGVFGSQGLALDPVDGTLWMSSGYTLYQFSQSGTPLQSVPYSVSGGGWYGMEFELVSVPEPAFCSLLGAGLACFLARRRARPTCSRRSRRM